VDGCASPEGRLGSPAVDSCRPPTFRRRLTTFVPSRILPRAAESAPSGVSISHPRVASSASETSRVGDPCGAAFFTCLQPSCDAVSRPPPDVSTSDPIVVKPEPAPPMSGPSRNGLTSRAAAIGGRLVRALQRRRNSPMELLDRAPAAVADALRGRRVEALPPSPPPKRHWMYLLDGDLILHLYGSSSDRITRSLPERTAFQREMSLPGVPELHISAREEGRTWVLEDRLHGARPDARAAGRWFPRASEWLVRLAGPPGPPLRQTAFWPAHQPGAILAAPADLQAGIARAWDVLGDLPARSLHGDVQPRNLLLQGPGVGLVDWEGFWRFGVPGLDLVFLALMSARRVPDQRVMEALARRSDPPDRPLRSPLAELGVDSDRLPAALLVMLSVWCLGERRRLERSGRRLDSGPFGALLRHVGPGLIRS
jgi:hypothetical protein